MEQEINFCPRCGSKTNRQERFGKLRAVCPNCSWIHFADPKVAAAVLVEQDNHVLLVRRVNEPYRGRWTLPAGFVDAGEDPARAAERECLEETSLTVRATQVLDIIAGREHPRGADFIIVYAAQVVSGVAQAGDDADQIGWFARSELPPLAFRATQKVLSQHEVK
ncbi:MAG TPA: NUDIX hydrolase [Anaerolineales bacterium]|nr:NUDIX hydrolase [Anaerolineales bacterium]